MRLRLASAVLLFFAIGGSFPAAAQQHLAIGISGKTAIAFLPVTIAERQGYYREQGLAVELDDFPGGPKAIEALIGGSVDLAVAAHEYTLMLQPKGIEMVSIVLLTRSFGNVLGLRPALASTYRSPRDLKGLRIGVTTPGSALAGVVTRVLAIDGLPPDAVAIIGIGNGSSAVAMMRSGQLDGVSQVDPAASRLITSGDIMPIIDARQPDGMNYIFGGEIAASVVLATPDFIAKHGEETQAFVTAIVRALQWMHSASLDDIVDLLPPDYYVGDKAAYRQILASNLPIFVSDGIVQADAAKKTLAFLMATGKRGEASDDELARTYDNRFVAAAAKSLAAAK